MKNKIKKNLTVYFGSAGGGKYYIKNSGITPDLFIDNNNKKWGKHFCDIPVVSPRQINVSDIAKIVITSGYVKDILPQILEMGIPRSKILIPPKSSLGNQPFRMKKNRLIASKKLHMLMDYFVPDFNIVAVGGCALGFMRDGDFIKWDNDIDLFAPIDSKTEIIKYFNINNFVYTDESESKMSSLKSEISLGLKDKIPLSIDFFDNQSKSFLDVFEDYSWEWPTDMFINCDKVIVNGFVMNVPRNPSIYLKEIYGKGWNIPREDFNYEDYGGDKA